jgi:hypothetical protein
MATNFPASLDALTDTNPATTLAANNHSGMHTDLNDAVEALRVKAEADKE